MNEHRLEERLKGWYAQQLEGATPPASLRASVADVPYAIRPRLAFRRSPVWALVLLVGLMAMLAVGAIATGALRLPTNALSRDEVLINADDRVIVAVDVRTGARRDIADGTGVALSSDRTLFIRATASGCYVTRVDGTDERKLDGCSSAAATWSPDGTRALFFDGEPLSSFFVANVATGHVTRLPWQESFKDTGTGSWSPDSRELVIPARDELIIADAGGHELGHIPTPQYAFGPRWSPDGRSIVYWQLGETWFVVNAQVGGEQFGKQTLSGSGFLLAWSPDGTQLAYVSGYSLHVVNRDGSHDRLLDDLVYPYIPGPQWSPDGSQILYGRNKSGSGTEAGPLMAIDVASGRAHVVFPTVSYWYGW